MQSHLQERPLAEHTDVTAFFSVQAATTAVLFVHGYGGNPIKTWSDFHLLTQAEPACHSRDLLFYGYDGLRAELVATAGLFRDFLDSMFTAPARIVNASLPESAQRSKSFEYQEIIIVAHSLGAVIARWALLSARDSGMSWMPKTRLVFFAPAHMGARVVDLAIEAAGGFKFLGLFARFAQFESPLIEQLNVGSPELTRLQENVAAATLDGSSGYLIPRAVIIAEYEHIVSNLRFGSDPEPIPLRGTDHFSVCKPRNDRRGPLDRLLSAL